MPLLHPHVVYSQGGVCTVWFTALCFSILGFSLACNNNNNVTLIIGAKGILISYINFSLFPLCLRDITWYSMDTFFIGSVRMLGVFIPIHNFSFLYGWVVRAWDRVYSPSISFYCCSKSGNVFEGPHVHKDHIQFFDPVCATKGRKTLIGCFGNYFILYIPHHHNCK